MTPSHDTILVVDDDSMTRLLLGQTLAQFDATIYEAVDGQEAIELFEKYSPSLVLLDVDLPYIDGFEVCKLIRQSPKGKHVPIVMITGNDDTNSIELAYQYGATDFVVKPINWSLIGHHLRYVMRSNRHFQALKENEQKLEYAQEFAKLGNWVWDFQHDEFQISRPLAKMLQLPETHFTNGFERFLNLVHLDERANVESIFNQGKVNSDRFDLIVKLLLANGAILHAHLQGQLHLDGGSKYISGIIQDISELRESQARIAYIANHDALTNLPNRVQFQQQLAVSIERASRSNTKLGLLYIDLDRFKMINDSLGHEVGDHLLCQVATRIKTTLRTYDHVARMGSDEFAVIFDPILEDDEVLTLTQQLLDLFESPFALLGQETYFARASVGICLFPENGLNIEDLQRNADSALYQAKRSTTDQFAFYSDKLTKQAQQKWFIENGLRQAIKNDGFTLLYQPKVDIQTGKMVGVEALIRCKLPEFAGVGPDVFIPIAEETGLIIPLGQWVISHAIAQLERWKGTACEHLSIAINVSGQQLHSDGFTDFVANTVEIAGVNTNQIEFEITEEYLISDNPADNQSESQSDKCLDTLITLRKLGISIAIDDFGTGYSSYSQLMNLPINTLKIDKSFVDHIPSQSAHVAIVKSMISLASNLELQVVAEGVETAEQLECLKLHGCHQVQGYYYSKPVPADIIMQMLTIES